MFLLAPAPDPHYGARMVSHPTPTAERAARVAHIVALLPVREIWLAEFLENAENTDDAWTPDEYTAAVDYAVTVGWVTRNGPTGTVLDAGPNYPDCPPLP